MRISDWSSDVCSSDLLPGQPEGALRDDVALDLVGDAVDRRGRREHEGLGVHAGLYAVPVGKRAVGAEDLDPEPGGALHDVRLRELADAGHRSEEHTSELQSLMRISYAVFCLKKIHSHINITTLYKPMHKASIT